MRDWQKEAPIWIADATKDLPSTATLKERRAALRKVGQDFHMGTRWGKTVWSKWCRRYLEQHGLPPISISTPGSTAAKAWDKMKARIASGEITLPFASAP